MRNTDINIKAILKQLEKLSQDVIELTVSAMKYNFEKEVQEYEVAKKRAEEALIKEFSGAYLKRRTDDSMFGVKLEILHVTSLQFETYDTEYEKLYQCKGELMRFSNINVHKRDLDTSRESFSEKDLRSCEIISKEEFDKYEAKLNELEIILTNLIEK